MATDAMQFAILGLISGTAEGAHGYQLKAEFDALCGDFWEVNYGQMYRTLDRLEHCGMIEGTEQIQTGRPNRRVYRITERGRQSLDDWLLLPPSAQAMPLRDELALKLLFLSRARLEDTLTLVSTQRARYLQQLARLNARRTALESTADGGFVMYLLLLQVDMRVRADLGWLDIVEREIRKRLGPRGRRS